MPPENTSTTNQRDVHAEAREIQNRFRAAAGAAVALLAIGTVFYHLVEHFRWLDSVYFCTITLTTIGYGDFVPKTDPGKVFTIFYVLIGIGIIGFFANTLLKNAYVKRELRRSKRKAS